MVLMWGDFAQAGIARVYPIDFLAISNGLKTFRIQAGRYPTEAEGLMALVEKPATYPADRSWQPIMKKLPQDPWGNPVHYIRTPRLEKEFGFGLYSTGADGISRSQGNDPDDWNSWTEDGRGRGSFMDQLKEVPVALWLALVTFVVGISVIVRSTRCHGAKAKGR